MTSSIVVAETQKIPADSEYHNYKKQDDVILVPFHDTGLFSNFPNSPWYILHPLLNLYLATTSYSILSSWTEVLSFLADYNYYTATSCALVPAITIEHG